MHSAPRLVAPPAGARPPLTATQRAARRSPSAASPPRRSASSREHSPPSVRHTAARLLPASAAATTGMPLRSDERLFAADAAGRRTAAEPKMSRRQGTGASAHEALRPLTDFQARPRPRRSSLRARDVLRSLTNVALDEVTLHPRVPVARSVANILLRARDRQRRIASDAPPLHHVAFRFACPSFSSSS